MLERTPCLNSLRGRPLASWYLSAPILWAIGLISVRDHDRPRASSDRDRLFCQCMKSQTSLLWLPIRWRMMQSRAAHLDLDTDCIPAQDDGLLAVVPG